jgi:hypothetical protein
MKKINICLTNRIGDDEWKLFWIFRLKGNIVRKLKDKVNVFSSCIHLKAWPFLSQGKNGKLSSFLEYSSKILCWIPNHEKYCSKNNGGNVNANYFSLKIWQFRESQVKEEGQEEKSNAESSTDGVNQSKLLIEVLQIEIVFTAFPRIQTFRLAKT